VATDVCQVGHAGTRIARDGHQPAAKVGEAGFSILQAHQRDSEPCGSQEIFPIFRKQAGRRNDEACTTCVSLADAIDEPRRADDTDDPRHDARTVRGYVRGAGIGGVPVQQRLSGSGETDDQRVTDPLAVPVDETGRDDDLVDASRIR
jgi:hypothetical protein